MGPPATAASAGAPTSGAAEDPLRPWMQATAGGCARAFEQLYLHTRRPVFGTVLRIVHARAQAEEVLQEVYVKVWSRSEQFDPQRGLVMHWLLCMAQRAAIDARRRAACRPVEQAAPDELNPYDNLPTEHGCPLSQVEQSQRERLVRNHLQTLPSEQKECLLLAFVEGLTHAEIAQRLSSPLGTIKSRIRRGLMTMRQPLQALQHKG